MTLQPLIAIDAFGKVGAIWVMPRANLSISAGVKMRPSRIARSAMPMMRRSDYAVTRFLEKYRNLSFT
jgi:hypothetical protein